MEPAVRELTDSSTALRETYGDRLDGLFSPETWAEIERPAFTCDRCVSPDPNGVSASVLVRCYYGCQHWQCASCAQHTIAEREEGHRYDGLCRGRTNDAPTG